MSSHVQVRRGRSVRSRTLTTALTFMALGLLVAGTVNFSLLFRTQSERVNAELHQEVQELRALAERGAKEGHPFHNVTDLLRAATDAAVPSNHESVLALVDGQPRFRPRAQDFDLTTPAIIHEITERHRPGETVTFEVRSPARLSPWARQARSVDFPEFIDVPRTAITGA